MLRYTTDRARPRLVALYDIRPGNGAGPFLQPRSPHGASSVQFARITAVLCASTSAPQQRQSRAFFCTMLHTSKQTPVRTSSLVQLIITRWARGDTIFPTPPAVAHLQPIAYTTYTCGTQRALCHEYSWSTGSGSLWAVVQRVDNG